jgi:deoxyribonuclease II
MCSTQPYVCVGDINRMQSQRNRGGGTVCFAHAGLWASLTAAIAKRDTC